MKVSGMNPFSDVWKHSSLQLVFILRLSPKFHMFVDTHAGIFQGRMLVFVILPKVYYPAFKQLWTYRTRLLGIHNDMYWIECVLCKAIHIGNVPDVSSRQRCWGEVCLSRVCSNGALLYKLKMVVLVMINAGLCGTWIYEVNPVTARAHPPRHGQRARGAVIIIIY